MPARSGIIQPDVFSYKDPNPIFPYGESIVSGGLAVRSAVNGYGAVSRGLLWQLYDIWIDTEYFAPITTTWSSSESVITTVWTSPQFGIYGEYTP